MFKEIINIFFRYAKTQSMNDIASGSRDLTVSLKVQGENEIGQVAQGFNTFVANIRSLVEQVVKTSLQLASAGDQMSSLSDQTLKGMRRLQAETDQVATASPLPASLK